MNPETFLRLSGLVGAAALALTMAACGGANEQAAETAKAPCDKPCDKPCDDCPDKAKAAAAEPGEAFQRIDIAGLDQKIKASEPVTVLDANSQERYDKGHIAGASHLVADDVTADRLPAAKDAMLVFYCGGPKCMASHQAASRAISLGYTNVWILPDGIQGWEAAGLATEKAQAN